MSNQRGRPRKKRLNTVNEWRMQNSGVNSEMAIMLVRMTPEIHDLIVNLRNKDIFKEQQKASWQKYYNSPPKFSNFVNYVLSMLNLDNSEVNEFSIEDALKYRKKHKKELQSHFADCFRNRCKIEKEESGKTKVSWVASGEADSFSNDNILELFSNLDDGDNTDLMHPALLFMLAVSFPCFMLYQEPIEVLLKKATQKDLDSMTKLLTLDMRFIDNTKVRAAFYSMLEEGNETQKDDLTNALKGKNTSDFYISIQSTKYLIASFTIKSMKFFDGMLLDGQNKLIAKHSSKTNEEKNKAVNKLLTFIMKPFRQNVNLPIVLELFNVIAIEKGLEYDYDLAQTPKGFESAMRRYLPLWDDLDLSKLVV